MALAQGAGAWTLDDPSRQVELRGAFQSLPLCEQLVINDRLKKVKFVKTIKYPEWAVSYGFGVMTLSDTLHDALLQRVFLHETGHFFDWAVWPRASETAEFEWAVAADFAAMDPDVADKNDYLKQPREAWAELFSEHFLPLTYYGTKAPFELNLMPQSRAAFLKVLYSKCPE